MGSERRTAAALAALGAAGAVLRLFCRAALARAVGERVMGLHQLLLPALALLLSAASAGPAAAAGQLAARQGTVGRERALGRILRRARAMFLRIFLPLALAGAIGSEPLCRLALGDGRLRAAFLLLLPCALLTGLENGCKQLLWGASRPLPPAVTDLAEPAVRTGAALLLLARFPTRDPGRALALVAAGMVLGECVSAGALALLTRPLIRERTPDRPDRARLRRLDRRLRAVALPVCLHALTGDLLAAALAALTPRLLILGGMGREAALAGYGRLAGMTAPLAALPGLFLGPVVLLLTPRVARAAARGDRREAALLTGRALGTAWTAALPFFTLLCLVGRQAAGLLYGRQEAARFLPLLAAAAVCAALRAVLAAAMTAAGENALAAGIGVGTEGALLALTVLLSRVLPGLAGPAWAMALTAGAELAACAWAGRRKLGLALRPGRGAWIPALAAGGMGLTGALVRDCLLRAGLGAGAVLGGTAGFCLVFYAAALAGMGGAHAFGLPSAFPRGEGASLPSPLGRVPRRGGRGPARRRGTGD